MADERRRELIALRDAARAAPEDPTALEHFAVALECQRFDGAALIVWHRLFVVLRRLGRIEDATLVCFNAIQLRPVHVHWRVRLACCLLREGRREEAAHHLAVASRHAVHPNDGDVTRSLRDRVLEGRYATAA